MRANLPTILAIALLGSLIGSTSSAQDPAVGPAHIDVEFVMEHREDGKKGGSVTHSRSTEHLADAPLRTRLTGLDDRSWGVTISYVGYANFQVARNAKNSRNEQLRSGHVFAVQVFTGKKDVTIKTAEKNVTKLVVYQKSPQTLYEDEGFTLTISNKK